MTKKSIVNHFIYPLLFFFAKEWKEERKRFFYIVKKYIVKKKRRNDTEKNHAVQFQFATHYFDNWNITKILSNSKKK